MNDRVTTTIENGIATITMDDGKVNAMSTPMLQAILQALDTAEEAKAVTVIRGREGIFSAGFDMKTFAQGPEASLEMIRNGAALILRLLRFPYPVLTVCTGHAYPMGAFLMLSADSRIGITGPWNIGMNEVAIAMTIPQFALELARHRLSPPAFARVNTAYLFGPEEAQAVGYLDRVVDPSILDATATTEVERLKGLDTLSFKETKARTHAPIIGAIESAYKEEFGDTSAGTA